MSFEGIPFDDRDGSIWFNGRLVPWREAKVHVLNHGLHYGSCVFEGTRVYNGKAFKLGEHNERLHNSAKLLGFEIPYSVTELDKACEQVIEAQNIGNGYLRPVAWRGSEQMAIMVDKSSIHVAIAGWELGKYFARDALEKGLKLSFAGWKRPSPETAPTGSKAAGLYMICTMSKMDAVSKGFDDALMLDWRGFVAEATGANFFLVINGELHTPTPDCFLDGITRRTVMSLAEKRGIKVIERHIKPEELADGQEAFLTGTAAEITPIGSISGEYGNFEFKIGPVIKQLTEDYSSLIIS